MAIEVVSATDDDGTGHQLGRRATTSRTGRPVVLVEPATVAATRAVLETVAEGSEPVGVVGFADLTAPNLVDLLDDLLAGPGGEHLRAIAVPWPASGADWVDDVAVRRGLACLQLRGLALRLLGTGSAGVPDALSAIEPELEVLAGPAPVDPVAAR